MRIYVCVTHIVTHRKMHSHNIIIYTTRFPTYTIFRSRGWEMKKNNSRFLSLASLRRKDAHFHHVSLQELCSRAQ